MSGKKHATGSDLSKVDAYVLRKRDYDEIPELTDEDFARGVWHRGGKPLRHGPRGRPKSGNPKHPVSLRLDPDVLAHFRHFFWSEAGGFVQEVAAGFELAYIVEQSRGPDIVDTILGKSHARGDR